MIQPDPARAVVVTLPEEAVVQRSGGARVVVFPRARLEELLRQLQEQGVLGDQPRPPAADSAGR